MHDWKFDKVYVKPDEEIEKLKQYYALLTPDFSLFTDMPLTCKYKAYSKTDGAAHIGKVKGKS